jgi:hypothetical protein
MLWIRASRWLERLRYLAVPCGRIWPNLVQGVSPGFAFFTANTVNAMEVSSKPAPSPTSKRGIWEYTPVSVRTGEMKKPQ